MAVHNGERHLAEAIDGILSQTFDDFEFLVVDDGSTDATAAILRSYDDRRIRLLVNERNIGLNRSLNRGLREACGELVARQDADDISEPERLERQVAFLDREPTYALVGAAYRKIDASGSILGDRSLPTEAQELRWHLLFYCPFIHPAALFRRRAAERAGLYDPTLEYAGEFDLFARLALRAGVANLPEPLVRYRVSEGSMTARHATEMEEHTARVISRNRRLVFSGAREVRASDLDVYAPSPELLGIPDRQDRIAAARSAARDILRLQEAFAVHYGLGRRERASHRAEVCYRLAAQLTRIARCWSDASSRRFARRLLWEGRALEALARVRGAAAENLVELSRAARWELAGS